MELDWGNLAAYAASAGLASAFFTHIVTLISSWWTSRRRAGHLALRLAVHLETYGTKCGTAYLDASNWDGTHGEDEGSHCYAPTFPDLPGASEAWEHLDPALSHRVLAFPYLVAENNEDITQFYEISGSIDSDGTKLKALDLGLKAFLVGRDLRGRYDIPQFKELENTVEWMTSTAATLRKSIAEYEERQRKYRVEMMSKTPGLQPQL